MTKSIAARTAKAGRYFFLKNRSRILISFAPLGTTGVYAPIRVSATTEIGTLVVKARRFEAISQ